MIYKIITCLSIITVSAYEKEDNPKVAVSSQSFHRSDVPISYKFHNVHNYNPKHNPENKPNDYSLNSVRYPAIQYAPLVHETRSIHHGKEQKETNEQNPITEPPVPPLHKEYRIHKTTNLQEKPKYDLEPKPLKEDDEVHRQNYKSFVSGHNVEVYPLTTGQYLEVDPYLTSQEISQKTKINSPKFVYYQKPTTEALETTPEHLTIELQKPTENYKLRQFLSADIKSPLQNVLPNNYNSPVQNDRKKPLPYAHPLHNILIKERQMQSYQHPRIHLNIARIYNIANQLQEARLPPLPFPRAPTQTNYGKPLPAINLVNSLPSNILGKQQAFSPELNSLPTKLGKQRVLSEPFVSLPTRNLGKVSDISAAFYLPEILNQQNTLMFPVETKLT